ncbi:MAG TPA: Ig-like domain-containing protein, partial [Actinomycetota bacterium]|nr:Ig-like domain-containing protein [Actinomycetota bacterium]
MALAAIACVVGSLIPLVAAAPARAATFSNTTPITGAEGPAVCGNGRTLPSTYPSNIAVSGQTGTISEVAITLHGLSGWNNDVDVLLVGPGGQKFIPLSDSGSAFIQSGATVTLTDAAGSTLPQTGAWPSSPVTARPTDYTAEPDVFPSPAPAGPYDHAAPTEAKTFASVFNGASANGTWSLYLTDDCIGDPTSISGGWSLNVTTAAAASTSTAVTSSANPSFTGDSVTFTAHVTKTSDSANVTAGTVTFSEGGTTLAANVPLNASGRATFSTSALTEGRHTITAAYNGTSSFATSNGSMSQTVDNRTTRTGSTFCNTGSVAVTTGAATPYPSRIFVSELGALSKVTVSLKNVTHPFPDDMDVLLVGPGGQKFVVVSDAGGGPPSGTSASGITVTFDDDAASGLADATGGWGAAGTSKSWRPANFDDGTDAFSAPAPAGPYSHPAPTGSATLSSVFAGADPNGTWQLLVQDDSLSDNGTVAGGWCLDFTTTSDAATTTSLTSSANPSFTGDDVTFTAHVTRSDTSADVTTGSVTFKNGSTVLAGPVALGGNGRATFTTDALTEGTHTIGAFYGGSPGSFNLSSDTVSQEVNDPTTGTGTTFCNTGAFPIGDPAGPGETGRATPYPSKVFVPSGAGTVGKVAVTLKNVSHAFSDDVDVLLVGPEDDAMVVVSDAGGGSPPNTATSNVTVTFDDSAAGAIADTLGGWGAAGTSVTSRPADYVGGDEFPAPAPAGPYGAPAPAGSATFDSVFGGTDAGGTWRLFVVDDSQGDAGTIANGWCLDLRLVPTATDDSYVAARNTTLDVAAPGVLDNDSGQPAPAAVAVVDGASAQG